MSEIDPRRPQDEPTRRWRMDAGLGVLVFVVAALAFLYRIADERPFVDEQAYLSQSYYTGLFAEGRINDAAWLEYPAYDLPPFPKYLIGASLAMVGQRPPGPPDARAWYGNTGLRFDVGKPGMLTAARAPIALVGALGCAAAYGLGVLSAGRTCGVLAALLLMINPLYRLHARRAMSDVPCEAFLLLGLLAILWSWKRLVRGETPRGVWVAAILSGAAFGLSLSSKFSGALGLMIAGAWGVLALALRPNGRTGGRLLVAGTLMTIVTGLVVLGLNPFLTTQPAGPLPAVFQEIADLSPWGRLRKMSNLRLEVSEGQQTMFPHNALRTLPDKLGTTAVQGFGRFGPLGQSYSDSTIRYDWGQDRGALVWGPLVLSGLVSAWRRGLNQSRAGKPPTAWAILVQFLVSQAVVGLYVPMAWDRYFLAIQAPAALLVAGFAADIGSFLIGHRTRAGRA